MKKFLAFLCLCPLLALGAAVTNASAIDTNLLSSNLLQILSRMKQLESSLQFQSGEIDLRNGLARIALPDKFRYLGATDARTVLEQFWGNPPDPDVLGLIVPSDQRFLKNSNAWAVVITYQNDGYVKDADAAKIDYTKLLKQMQADAQQGNKERAKEGYPAVELVGWAAPPHYDQENKKLYWAQELKFEDTDGNQLNYKIRILGRKGVLELNAIASMEQFPEIDKAAPDLVKMVEFKSGNRYADFNGSTDKVAAYGLAALVAGGIAAKAGLFKVLLVGILAAKKFVIIGVIACWAFVKKMISKSKQPPGASA